MIARRVTRPIQPALLALEDSTIVEKAHLPTVLQNDSTKAESQAGGLGSDPLEDEERQARRRAMARTLCQNGANPASWELANRLAVSWGFSCAALGVARPADEEGDRRRRVGVVQRG